MKHDWSSARLDETEFSQDATYGMCKIKDASNKTLATLYHETLAAAQEQARRILYSLKILDASDKVVKVKTSQEKIVEVVGADRYYCIQHSFTHHSTGTDETEVQIFIQPGTDGSDCSLHAGKTFDEALENLKKAMQQPKTVTVLDKVEITGYPPDWPACPSCGKPALDGHITCGDVNCNESAARGTAALPQTAAETLASTDTED